MDECPPSVTMLKKLLNYISECHDTNPALFIFVSQNLTQVCHSVCTMMHISSLPHSPPPAETSAFVYRLSKLCLYICLHIYVCEFTLTK